MTCLPTIILVKPQMGANIGAAARAIHNFGLNDLRIVDPRDGWPNIEADRNASGALELMPPIQVFENLADAIADLHYTFATTARSRELAKPLFEPADAAAETQNRIAKDQKVGFIFGGERAGLSNDDIALAHAILHIPTNPEFSSLNLAQAVLLIAYEYSKTYTLPSMSSDHAPAPQKEFEDLITRLEQELEDHNFFRTDGLRAHMKRNIRTALGRAEMSEQEIRTLHGVISALTGKKAPPE